MTDPSITDWIGAISSALGVIVVVVGLLVAFKQLAAWRVEKRAVRRSEIAEELLIAAYNASDLLKSVRSRFDSIPIEKDKDKIFPLQRRYDRFSTNAEIFKSLRQAQFRSIAIIGNEEVDSAVNTLFKIRGEIMSTIEIYADFVRDDALSDLEADELVGYRKTMFGSYGETDELGQRQLKAVEEIDKGLRGIARLNGK